MELIEEKLEKAWLANRDGFDVETINPWDPVISLTATVRAALTTGNAIMLSAMTTIIGFSVLTWSFLVPQQVVPICDVYENRTKLLTRR